MLTFSEVASGAIVLIGREIQIFKAKFRKLNSKVKIQVPFVNGLRGFSYDKKMYNLRLLWTNGNSNVYIDYVKQGNKKSNVVKKYL